MLTIQVSNPATDAHDFAFPRRDWRPSDASAVSLLKEEGAGNAGRWPHPQACVQKDRNAHKIVR
jgi:hypothetical protein